jgi:hypothetical protein
MVNGGGYSLKTQTQLSGLKQVGGRTRAKGENGGGDAFVEFVEEVNLDDQVVDPALA